MFHRQQFSVRLARPFMVVKSAVEIKERRSDDQGDPLGRLSPISMPSGIATGDAVKPRQGMLTPAEIPR
jgi:hypothetical protein